MCLVYFNPVAFDIYVTNMQNIRNKIQVIGDCMTSFALRIALV